MAAVLEAFTGEHEDYFVDRCFEIACDERAPFIVLGGLPPTVAPTATMARPPATLHMSAAKCSQRWAGGDTGHIHRRYCSNRCRQQAYRQRLWQALP